MVMKDVPREATFDFGLLPGRTYKVIVKTMSGNVQSWPATGNITTSEHSTLRLIPQFPILLVLIFFPPQDRFRWRI